MNAIVNAFQRLVIVVKGLVSHHSMHNDELLARWFLITFGRKLFPGGDKAPLTLLDSGLRNHMGKTGQQWLVEGYPFLGTGGGPFDEHDLPEEERAQTSAATLMAEYLGIAEFPAIRQMLEHAVRVDRTATASGFDISALFKAWHRNNVPTAKVLRMFDRAAEARFNVLSGKVRNTNWTSRPDLNALAAEWLIGRVAPVGYKGPVRFATAYEAAKQLGVFDSEMLGPVLEYMLEGKHNPGDYFTLAGTVTAMNKDGASAGEIREIVGTSLDAKVIEQTRFLEGLDLLHALKKEGRLYVKGTTWSIMHVASDNTEINRAARNVDKNYDVFMQDMTDGHVVIWYNKKRINMDEFAARLRDGDRAIRQMDRLGLDSLKEEGTLPLAPWWYYNPSNGQVMCGSLTNKNTAITKLDSNTRVQMMVLGMKAIAKPVREHSVPQPVVVSSVTGPAAEPQEDLVEVITDDQELYELNQQDELDRQAIITAVQACVASEVWEGDPHVM